MDDLETLARDVRIHVFTEAAATAEVPPPEETEALLASIGLTGTFWSVR